MEVIDGKISQVKVARGAPCGATWEAAKRVLGLAAKEACDLVGLEVQFLCKADPSGWDPTYGKSPVHFAGTVHKLALRRALRADNR